MEGIDFTELYILLGNFKLNQRAKIIENDNIIYEGTMGEITLNISNMAHVKQNSVYIDDGVVVIPIRYEKWYLIAYKISKNSILKE